MSSSGENWKLLTLVLLASSAFCQVAAQSSLTGFVDTSHVSEPGGRRSVAGCAFTICNVTMAHKSENQTITVSCSTEAGFVTAFAATRAA